MSRVLIDGGGCYWGRGIEGAQRDWADDPPLPEPIAPTKLAEATRNVVKLFNRQAN
jgi:hypothetical protein